MSERAAWLYQKSKLHAEELGWRDRILEFAEIRSEYWVGEEALFEALDDPLVADVALFEGGAFTDFVDSRGDLLPPDELALARQWQEIERSVHEVEEVRPGVGLTLRDLHAIRERTASRQLHVGNLICARVVPAGDTWQIFGGIEPIARLSARHSSRCWTTRPRIRPTWSRSSANVSCRCVGDRGDVIRQVPRSRRSR